MVFPPRKFTFKHKRAILRYMKKPHSLKVRSYATLLIYLNEYLASFPGATMADNMGVTELNEILLNSMPNRWSKQAYVQIFDCDTISLKNSINMFERMEISESIYEGVVTHSYKKLLGQKPTVLDSVGIRKEKPPLQKLTPQMMRAMASAINNM